MQSEQRQEANLAKLHPSAKLHVILAPHVIGEQRLGYKNALAIGALLTRGDEPGEYIVEIFNSEKLRRHRHMLPYWERSGVCRSWWIEGESEFPSPPPE